MTFEAVGAGPDWVVRGGDALKAMVIGLHSFTNDAKIVLRSELCSGDRSVIEYEECSTNTGKVARGIPATNRRYTVWAASVGQFDSQGKIKEERGYLDRLDIYAQRGLLKAPGA